MFITKNLGYELLEAPNIDAFGCLLTATKFCSFYLIFCLRTIFHQNYQIFQILDRFFDDEGSKFERF